MANVKFTYKQDADTVYDFITNPEIIEERSKALGERDIQITKDGERITNRRMGQAAVPGFAKKLLKPENLVIEVKSWDRASKSCTFDVDVQGAPTKVNGKIQIVPAGSGCDYLIEFKVTASIPLIGKKLEKYATGITEDGMRDEFNWNQTKLDSLA